MQHGTFGDTLCFVAFAEFQFRRGTVQQARKERRRLFHEGNPRISYTRLQYYEP